MNYSWIKVVPRVLTRPLVLEFYLGRIFLWTKRFDSIKESIKSDLDKAYNLQDIVDIKARYVGKQGLITRKWQRIWKIILLRREKEIGKVTNELKNLANDMISLRKIV